jgi:hypothetical protein
VGDFYGKKTKIKHMIMKNFLGLLLILIIAIFFVSCKRKYKCRIENHSSYNLEDVRFGFVNEEITISIPPNGYVSDFTLTYKKAPFDAILGDAALVGATIFKYSDGVKTYTNNIGYGLVGRNELSRKKENIFVLTPVPNSDPNNPVIFRLILKK